MIDPPAFEIETEQRETGATILVRGDMDIATVQQLARAREQVLAERPSRLLLDLREVEFVDSSGPKFLIDTLAISHEDGWRLEIYKPGQRAMRVFEVTGAIEHLPFIDRE